MRYLSCNLKSMSLGSLTVLEEATKRNGKQLAYTAPILETAGLKPL